MKLTCINVYYITLFVAMQQYNNDNIDTFIDRKFICFRCNARLPIEPVQFYKNQLAETCNKTTIYITQAI